MHKCDQNFPALQNSLVMPRNHNGIESGASTSTPANSKSSATRQRNGFSIFVKLCKEEHEAKYAKVKVDETEIHKKCLCRWKDMTKKEQKCFDSLL